MKDSKKCPARSKAGECRANASVRCSMKNCVVEFWKEAPAKKKPAKATTPKTPAGKVK